MNVLMWGSTEHSADLWQAVPISIIDPFLYLEAGGKRVATLAVFEHDRINELGLGLEVRDHAEFGRTDLLKQGWDNNRASFEVALRVCREYGVTEAAVPFDFPLAVAEYLRDGGVDLHVDEKRFEQRRRTKTPHQIAGIRRAQAAADASMAVAAQMLRECREGLTSEEIRDAMGALCAERGCVLADDVVVAVNGQGASGHDKGSGAIARGDRIVIDIWPRDKASRCFADMTRSFIAGGEAPDEEMSEYWRLAKKALDSVLPEIRPGVTGRRLYDLTCDVYEAAGHPTLRNTDGTLNRGFFHSLGHGVGVEVHEQPGLGLAGKDELVPGDVIAVEPGCYRPGYGGVRLEDLILVTDDGCENLTDFPYGLEP